MFPAINNFFIDHFKLCVELIRDQMIFFKLQEIQNLNLACLRDTSGIIALVGLALGHALGQGL